MTTSATERVLPALARGALGDALALMSSDAVLDFPIQGRATGGDVGRVLSEAIEWLLGREAILEAIRDTQSGGRTVSEWLLHLRGGEEGRVELPVAIVGEERSGFLTSVRVYHSLWPLRGAHGRRPPVVEAQRDLDEVPEVIRRYQSALRAGDLEAILGTFASGGCAREPSGGAHRYTGAAELRRFYAGLFVDGGIVLRHKTVTDDGVATAIEYDVTEWGGRALEPSPGVAVYERNEAGLLAAARIYDDAEQPA